MAQSKRKSKAKTTPAQPAAGKKSAKPSPASWRDEVGRSGIYPMSGPLPEGDAPLRGEMEFGQGERGAAGFFESGGSELVYSGGQLLGGYEAGSRPEPKAKSPARSKRAHSAKAAPAPAQATQPKTPSASSSSKLLPVPKTGRNPSTHDRVA